MTRGFIRQVATVTSRRYARVVERDAGECGGAGVAGVAVLAGLDGWVCRCFAHQPHGDEHAAVTGVAADCGNVVVIEVGRLRKRLRCHVVTQNALGTRRHGNVQRRFVAEVAGVAAGGDTGVIKRGAGKRRRIVVADVAVLSCLCGGVGGYFTKRTGRNKRTAVAAIATHRGYMGVTERGSGRELFGRYGMAQYAF